MIITEIPEFVALILKRLKKAGHGAYIVGGAIRDAFLRRPITDWDVATSATVGQIKSIFSDKKFYALKHETVTLVNSGRSFEVTTFRGKTNRIEDDLAHRDFTLNALAYEPETGRILDPHSGKADIRSKIIRAVEDPGARFREDPLRLLRAVRIAAELKFRIEKETLDTMTRMAFLLQSVSAERIREELMKVLLCPTPSTGFNLMVRTGLIQHFLPELLEGYRMRQNTFHRYTVFKHIMETLDRVEPTPVLRLTALLHDIAKPRVKKKIEGQWRFLGHERASASLSEEIMNRLKFSKSMTRKVINLIGHHMIGYDSQWSDAAVRRLIRRVGRDDIKDLMMFRRADIYAHGLDNRESELLNDLEKRTMDQLDESTAMTTRDLAIDGSNVMDFLEISQGPKVGKILSEMMERVTEHPEENTREGLLAFLERMKRP
jgi:poly(A) polymerase/tRNA nucleotidyltransferase (CCA-adding enzyme)